MFALLRKVRKLFLPIDIILKLFDSLVKPVILYGTEVWGSENSDIIEQIQLRFCKYLLSVKKSTCTNMVYGELGVMPVDIDIKSRLIGYWARLISGHQNKISNMVYLLLYKLDVLKLFHSDWINTVKTTLNLSGFSGIWLNQCLPYSVAHFKTIFKIRLKDQFIQKWQTGISEGGKCTVYRIIKSSFGLETYLLKLPLHSRKVLTKFRCRNHRLPIERASYENVLRDMRICHFCRKDIGDEYHYILCCPHFSNERKKYICTRLCKSPSTFNLNILFNKSGVDDLKKLTKFVRTIMSQF